MWKILKKKKPEIELKSSIIGSLRRDQVKHYISYKNNWIARVIFFDLVKPRITTSTESLSRITTSRVSLSWIVTSIKSLSWNMIWETPLLNHNIKRIILLDHTVKRIILLDHNIKSTMLLDHNLFRTFSWYAMEIFHHIQSVWSIFTTRMELSDLLENINLGTPRTMGLRLCECGFTNPVPFPPFFFSMHGCGTADASFTIVSEQSKGSFQETKANSQALISPLCLL